MSFGRLITAMATPFQTDGALDETALHRLVDHLIATGTTALVASGTTGESPTLAHAEKLRLFEQTLRAADGRVPVIAGVGGNDTAVSINLAKQAAELGVHGLLLVAPYYNKPTQDGLYAHFSAIAHAVSIPIVLYNVPSRTSVNIEPDTVLRLAEIPNVVALKEATSDFSQIAHIAAAKPDDFYLYSGDDKFTLPLLAYGGYGVVSVASHVVGPEMAAMIEAYVRGDVQTAASWAGRLLPIFEALFRVSNPAPLKAALALMNVPCGDVRLPLVPAPSGVVDELQRELARLGKLEA